MDGMRTQDRLTADFSAREVRQIEALKAQARGLNTSVAEVLEDLVKSSKERSMAKKKAREALYEMLDPLYEILCRTYNSKVEMQTLINGSGIGEAEFKTSAKPLNMIVKKLCKTATPYTSKIISALRYALHRRIDLGKCAEFVKACGGINECASRYRRKVLKKDLAVGRTALKGPRFEASEIETQWQNLRSRSQKLGSEIEVVIRGSISPSGVVTLVSFKKRIRKATDS